MKKIKYQGFQSKEDITHVYGMSTLALLTYNDKKVYVFGEEHTTFYDCNEYEKYVVKARIDEFISYILETNSDKIIDIYTEEEYISNNEERIREKEKRYFAGLIPEIDFEREIKNEMKGSGLDYILSTFKNCLSFVKNCEYPNARFHYTDMRDIFPNIRNIFEKIDEIENEKSKIKIGKKMEELEKLLYNINYNDEYILEKIRFYKQLESVDKILGNKLDNIAKRKLRQIPLLKKNNGKEFAKETADYFMNYMDLYLIARMLKNYSQNIMIFVGDSHAKNIISILKELGFTLEKKNYKEEFLSKETYSQCIDLSEFPNPFSNNYKNNNY